MLVYGLPLVGLVAAVLLVTYLTAREPLSPFWPLVQFVIISLLTVGACAGVKTIGARLQRQVDLGVADEADPCL